MSDLSVRIEEPLRPKLVISKMNDYCYRFSINEQFLDPELLYWFEDGMYDAHWNCDGFDTTMARNLNDELYSVVGVERVRFDRYSTFILRGEAFDWIELLPGIITCIANAAFMEEIPKIKIVHTSLSPRVRACIRKLIGHHS